MADTNFQLSVGAKVVDNIQQQLDKMTKKTVTVTPILNSSGVKEMEKTVKTYTDGLGRTIQTTQKFNVATGQTSTYVSKVSDKLQVASKHTKTLGEDFLSTAGKVAKFGAITAMLGLFTTGVSEAIKSVKEMDSAMVEFNKVSNISEGSLDNYVKKLGEIGTEVGRTATEMLSASTEFIKAGYNEQQSAQLAKVASLYQNIADSEVTSADASAYLISQMKAFNITASDSMTIIDMTNEVANRFAVSSTDISTALTKSSSALATYGNTMSESIALTTAG